MIRDEDGFAGTITYAECWGFVGATTRASTAAWSGRVVVIGHGASAVGITEELCIQTRVEMVTMICHRAQLVLPRSVSQLLGARQSLPTSAELEAFARPT